MSCNFVVVSKRILRKNFNDNTAVSATAAIAAVEKHKDSSEVFCFVLFCSIQIHLLFFKKGIIVYE